MITPSSERGPVVATHERPNTGASEGGADSASPSASGGGEVPIGTLIDASADEPLPSTRPDGRAARERETARVQPN